MSEPTWTPEQRRAIDRRDGDLLLDAGAGSGKTSVLVERFVSSVLQDGIDVTAMLTITFTEKAAAELRDRIRSRLRQLGAHEAARRTEGAFISTIHGFCARVLRANALAAGLDPRFAVLDRDRSEPLATAAFEDALEALASAHDGAVELIAAYGAGPLRAAVRGVHAQLRSAGQRYPRLPPIGEEALAAPGAVAAALASAAAAVAAELRAIDNPGARVCEALDCITACEALLAQGDVWPCALGAARLPRNGAALTTDACVRYAEALADFRARCAALAAAPVRDLLDALLDGYGRHYERRKRAISGLDFEDLELVTRDLISGDAELRQRYASRFDRIMVDELQDTNRVQLELIESIASGNLFTVGDAQQSIYGFRHAEVELFERRGERMAQLGARETLQTNFRSQPEILDALNAAFAGELGERYRSLRAGRGGAGAGAQTARVELVLVDKGCDWEQEGVASPWRLAEARTLADRLAELVAAGVAPKEIVVLMRATTDMRAYERALERCGLPTYVIGGRGYWSHPQVVDLVAYLRVLANPRDEEALYGVLASPIVGVSLDALVILAAAARDSNRDPWWLLREPRNELDELGGGDRALLHAFTAWFSTQRERLARSSIEAMIDSALSLSGYDLAMLALPGGRRRLANVRKLMRLARDHEHANGPDLHGFLEVVEDRAAGRLTESRESEAPVEGEGLDAIRLMTIHRAKGLEFPVVAVADLGRSVRPAVQLLRVSADGRIGIRLARAGVAGRESALDYVRLRDEQLRAAEREERRLFYVAMTRARDHLILSGATKFDGFIGDAGRNGGGPVAWIAPAFVPDLGAVLARGGGVVQGDGGTRIAVRVGRPRAVEKPPPESGTPPAPARPPASAASASASVAPPPASVAPPPPPSQPPPASAPVSTLSYSSLQEYARCGYRFYTERVLGVPAAPEARPAERLTGGPRSAADRGVLLHALLERLDFRRPVPPSPEVIRSAASAAGLEPAPGPAEVDELVSVIRRFAASELCARLARATDARREERFAFTLGPGPRQPLIVGVIDVLAREPRGRTLIVDYKSDRLQGAAPAAVAAGAYATQRLIYALAALRSGAISVDVAHCFLEVPEQPVVVCFDRDGAARLEAELAALQRGVLAREFPVSPAPCAALCTGCPAEGGLCSWPLQMTRRESPDTLF